MLLNTRTNTRPWRVLPKSNKRNREEKIDGYVEKLRKFMAEKVMTFDYVIDKINEKYNTTKKTKQIKYLKHRSTKLASVYLNEPIQVKRLTNIGNGFSRSVNTHIQNGEFEQFPYLWALYGKMTSHSFGIIESVQRAINNEPLILTAKSGLPFTENACCSEGEVETLAYFSKKSPSITRYNNVVKDLSEIYYFYKNLSNAPLFSIKQDTK